jgi:hypothetical protein
MYSGDEMYGDEITSGTDYYDWPGDLEPCLYCGSYRECDCDVDEETS